jgi:hypothetical protein
MCLGAGLKRQAAMNLRSPKLCRLIDQGIIYFVPGLQACMLSAFAPPVICGMAEYSWLSSAPRD